jgi:hypothetical protein
LTLLIVVDLSIYPSAFFSFVMAVGLYFVRRQRSKLGIGRADFKAWHVAVVFTVFVNLFLLIMPWCKCSGFYPFLETWLTTSRPAKERCERRRRQLLVCNICGYWHWNLDILRALLCSVDLCPPQDWEVHRSTRKCCAGRWSHYAPFGQGAEREAR